MPPNAPAHPARPITEATAVRGKQSELIVYRFADQPWCAAVAMPTKATVSQRLPAACGTNATAQTDKAQTSMAVLRAPAGEKPRFNKAPESQPPPIEPMSAAR